MKKAHWSLAVLLLFMLQTFAQKHEFIIYTKSVKGKIEVYVDGEYDGKTGGKYAFKVRFDDENPSHSFTLHKEGYENKKFTYDRKPGGSATKVFWAMQEERFKLNEKLDHTFDFSRVKFDIDPSAQVSTIPGNTEYWSSIGIEEGNVDVFKKSIHDELITTGFKGIKGYKEKEDDLFSDNKDDEEEVEADISIGAIITDLEIGGHYGGYNPYTGGSSGRIYDKSFLLKVEWQFYDNIAQKILYKVTTNEQSHFVKEYGDLVEGINMSFGLNFSAALKDPKLIAAIKGVEAGAEKAHKAKVLKEYSIVKPKVETYASYGKMIKAVNPSVVTLKGKSSHGSGFIISKEGYILTNYHVIEDEENIKAVFQQGFELPIEVLSYDKKHDLALLKVTGSGFKPLSISVKENELGDDVIAIGTPQSTDLSNTITKGIVSGNRKTKKGIKLIQTDVSVSPGNSGGPLINNNGEVVGIVSQKLISVGTEGIAFAIPMSVALEKLNITIK